MTEHVARLYAVAGSLLTLFVGWAAIAARPWHDSRPAVTSPALVAYERRLADTARLVSEVRARAEARAPAVRVVTLPPLTTTRTS
jgi:hypothetical protein